MKRSVQILGVTAALIIVRAAYVWFEGAYNVALLDMVSTQQLTSQQAESVQLLGHKLAAIGLALLVTPFLIGIGVKGVVGAAKRLAYGVVFGFMGFSSIYIGAYHLQTWVMDTAVESTSAETRYDAYYSAIFRQLYIDGNIVDQGFSPSPKTAAQVMWLPFGVSESVDLPSQLQADAAGIVLERARKQLALERFEKDYQAYLSYQEFTREFLADYRRLSDEAIAKADVNEHSAANLYGSIVESIHDAYAGYQRVSESYAAHSSFVSQNGWFVRDVREIFSASEHERKWRHGVLLKSMQIEPRWLDVDDWCKGQRCPGSSDHVKQVIRSALAEKYKTAARGVPMGLSAGEVLQSHTAFNAALSEAGVPVRFDRSPVTWESFRKNVDSTALLPNVAKSMSGAYPRLGGAFLPAGLSDQKLTQASQFNGMIAERLGDRMASLSPALTKDQFFVEWLKATDESIDRNRAVLLPEDASQMEAAANLEAGYSAVRLLYIPPIAAALSAAMIVLNLAAVASNLFSLGISGWIFRVASVVVLVFVGYGVGGSVGMPTESATAVWAEYQDQSMLMAALWQVLFGVEYLAGSVASIYDVFMSPEDINVLIEKGLGWVL